MRANLLAIFGLIMPLCLSSCHQDNLSNFVSAKEQEQSNKVVPLEYGEVLTQKTSEYIIVPVGYKLKVEQDTNQNQVLDLEDADRGYLSDLSGKNLRSLTPDHTKLSQWHCDYRRNQLLLFVQELDRESQKDQINPTALYIYDLAGNEPFRVTPPQSNLEHWKIKLADGLLYLHSRIDSNGDRQYTSTDDTIVTKYNLDSKQALEINHPQIRQLLQQQQK